MLPTSPLRSTMARGACRAVIAVALAAGACGSAAAQATAWSHVSGFRYSLQDLDPDDGNAPALTWHDVIAPARASAYYGSAGGPVSSNGAPINEHWTRGNDTMLASVNGIGQLSTTAIGVASTSVGTPPHYYNNLVYALSQWYSYTLAPGAGVTFQIDYAFSALLLDPSGNNDFARAFAYTAGYLEGASGDTSELAETGSTDGTISTGTLTAYVENTTDRVLTGSFAFGAEAYTRRVSVVPEPATWAMLGAGIALLAWRGRRA